MFEVNEEEGNDNAGPSSRTTDTISKSCKCIEDIRQRQKEYLLLYSTSTDKTDKEAAMVDSKSNQIPDIELELMLKLEASLKEGLKLMDLWPKVRNFDDERHHKLSKEIFDITKSMTEQLKSLNHLMEPNKDVITDDDDFPTLN